jgi:hypothetical protein
LNVSENILLAIVFLSSSHKNNKILTQSGRDRAQLLHKEISERFGGTVSMRVGDL